MYLYICVLAPVYPFGVRDFLCIIVLRIRKAVIKIDRLAQIGIIIQDITAADRVNDILHDYSSYIVGRMGLPYKKYGVMVISIIIDAPVEIISALTGKLGMIKNVTAKSVMSKLDIPTLSEEK